MDITYWKQSFSIKDKFPYISCRGSNWPSGAIWGSVSCSRTIGHEVEGACCLSHSLFPTPPGFSCCVFSGSACPSRLLDSLSYVVVCDVCVCVCWAAIPSAFLPVRIMRGFFSVFHTTSVSCVQGQAPTHTHKNTHIYTGQFKDPLFMCACV